MKYYYSLLDYVFQEYKSIYFIKAIIIIIKIRIRFYHRIQMAVNLFKRQSPRMFLRLMKIIIFRIWVKDRCQAIENLRGTRYTQTGPPLTTNLQMTDTLQRKDMSFGRYGLLLLLYAYLKLHLKIKTLSKIRLGFYYFKIKILMCT